MRLLGSWLLLACAGCPAHPASSDGGADLARRDGATACPPGQQQACDCLTGTQGVQTCRSNGNGFGTCVGCPATSDDGGTTVGNKCGDCDGCCDGTTCLKYADQTDERCG